MKNLYKILALTLFTLSSSLFTVAQTNVSGGIYSNTTWTLNNSPYIVVDTVVVFPGVTLTIEAGVVVKFDDHMRLEIRQGNLICFGTISDSITFTSNNNNPTPGIWGDVYVNDCATTISFNYCNFSYATSAINRTYVVDSLIIKNSNFNYNISGTNLWPNNYVSDAYIDSCNFSNSTYGTGRICSGSINHCNFINNAVGTFPCGITILNSKFISNQIGIRPTNPFIIQNCIIDSNTIAGVISRQGNDKIQNCYIRNNAIGISDSAYQAGNLFTMNVIENNNIGIKTTNSTANIYCNKICNNSTWDLYYNVQFGNNFSMPGNYWCNTDSATIHSRIYDGYTNVNLGLVSIFPIDTTNCYLTGCNLQLTFSVTNATCDTCHTGSATVTVANGFGPYTYTWNTAPIQTTQTAINLASGTYTVCVIDANGCTACQSVYVDSTNCSGFSMTLQGTNSTCFNCNDGTASANISGGTSPYSYTWYTIPLQYSQTATGLHQGTYQVCVVDAYGCVLCDSITIGTGSCSANFVIYPDTNIQHHYWAVNQASGVPPLTYDWNWGDNSTHDFTANPSHIYANQGSYTICLTITDSVGCQNEFCQSFYLLHPKNLTPVTVNVVSTLTGINSQFSTLNSQFIIYPNPNDGNFTISNLRFTNYDLRITDILGQEVYRQTLNNSTQSTIQLNKLNNGVYFYQLSNSKETIRGKFVKE